MVYHEFSDGCSELSLQMKLDESIIKYALYKSLADVFSICKHFYPFPRLVSVPCLGSPCPGYGASRDWDRIMLNFNEPKDGACNLDMASCKTIM